MSQSLYPVTREPNPPYRESGVTKVLALLLLAVAGALVFTVVQQRRQTEHFVSVEPRPVAQRPDDKLGADEQLTIDVFSKFSRSVAMSASTPRTEYPGKAGEPRGSDPLRRGRRRESPVRRRRELPAGRLRLPRPAAGGRVERGEPRP